MSDFIVVRGKEVEAILDQKEELIMNLVEIAYVKHRKGDSSLPHSVFLRFPNNDRNRIIGLPAYLGGDVNCAGMKWISSFPGNIEFGIERASAVIILNSVMNGHPEAILESSYISAKRTAASATLAAVKLHKNKEEENVGFIGCGRINREISLFLRKGFTNIKKAYLFDLDEGRASEFADNFKDTGIEIAVCKTIEEVFEQAHLISVATTAGTPYIKSLKGCTSETTILNISLRDFSEDTVFQCDNIVDDIDHVCRENTSMHLAEKVAGNRDFIRCPLADIVTGKEVNRIEGKPVMFSPFGLGILDLAVACHVLEEAKKNKIGTEIEDFLQDKFSNSNFALE